jgi:UDP:flavonoid glycosyltransferase YjiC (YdhE family)
LPRYHAAVIHGGTGVVYSCIKAGVPALIWPQDYDQFDNAARVVGRGLGLRLTPNRARLVADLLRLLSDEVLRSRVRAFQGLAARYDAPSRVLNAVRRLALGRPGQRTGVPGAQAPARP